MAHFRPLADQVPGMNQYPFQRKGQQELSPGGRKNMSAIGSMKGKKLGFGDDLDDDYNGAGMYFNPSGFPPHRPDKEIPSASQPLSHLGGLYGTPSGMQSPGPHQSNFYSSGLAGNAGFPPSGSSMQVPPGSNPRGMSSSQHPFGRSMSHPASNHPSSSMSGSGNPAGPSIPPSLHNMGGMPGNNMTSQSNSRGILSMGSQGIMGRVLPGSTGMSGANPMNNIPKSSRTITLPTSLSSSGGGLPSNSMSGFNLSRSQSTSGGLGSSGLQSTPFSSQSAGNMISKQQWYSIGAVRPPAVPSDTSAASSASLDLSEFPALANRGRQEALQTSSSSIGGALVSEPPMPSMPTVPIVTSSGLVARPSYGVVSKPTEPPPDFSIHNEDFPALPGFKGGLSESHTEGGQDSGKQQVLNTTASMFPGSDIRGNSTYEQALKDVNREARYSSENKTSNSQTNSKVPPRGIQTSPSGVITNIPKGMVTDQFGMIGLLTFIRAAETEPNLVTLALGSDLTTLGLNLNSPESLYHTFGSPFADSPCRPHEIDYHVPSEYRVNTFIREKLAQIKLSRYNEDLLFYLYYTSGGDILQLAAAAELYSRDWRYHKEERVWLTRAPGFEPQMKTGSYEKGTYYFFDCNSWRKVPKEFYLEYEKLEEKPTLQPIPAQ